MAEKPPHLQVSDVRRRRHVNIVWLVICVSSSRIENYTPDMSEAEVEESIDKALLVWAKVTPLRFSKVSSDPADIKVSFGRRCKYDKD